MSNESDGDIRHRLGHRLGEAVARAAEWFPSESQDMSSNERIEAIRKLYKSAEWLEDDYGQTLIEVEKLGEVLKHAEALATALAEAEARIVRTESLLFANWGVNGTMDITPAMERTLHYARTGEQLGEVDPWPHLDADGNPIRDATERPEHAPEAAGSPESDGRGA